MLALVVTVLTASLLGSLHCAGMCGAFLAVAVMPGESAAPRWLLHAAYNGGRLVTYVVLGALAGLLGQALDLGGQFVGVPRVAAIGAGIVMVLFGLVQVGRVLGWRLPRAAVPGPLQRLAAKAHEHVWSWSPPARALAIGLLTTLLPCGWLYAFVTLAAGTGRADAGALVMGSFWVGTLPIMMAFGIGLQKLTGPLRRHLPLATSVLIAAVGLFTILGRLNVTLPTPGSDPAAAPLCHGQ